MASLQMTARPAAAAFQPRAAPAQRPVARRAALRQVVVRAEPTATDAKTAVETAIEQAKETCKDGTNQECAAAWDEVEELAAHASHKKEGKSSDPLEEFCDDNPDADECRVYED